MGNPDQPRDERGRWTSSAGASKGLSDWVESMRPQLDTAKSIRMREVSPAKFKAAFTEAFKDSEFSSFVSHYSEEELSRMTCVLSKDGKTGVAIKDHGDGRVEATALFNRSETKGAGVAALVHAVAKRGANYVECYSGQLDKMYAKLGFVEQTRDPFNREYASPSWNYEKHGTPDYVTMRHKYRG